MATVSNPWVGYLVRSYQQVKDSLLARLVVSNPEITDHSESNILIIIISMFAGVTEMLNYYVDNMAREAFIGTARKYTSMVRLVKLLDYRIKARNSATVDIRFDFDSPASGANTIAQGTIISTSNGIRFVVDEDIDMTGGEEFVEGTATQFTTVTGAALGTSDASANQKYSLGTKYVDGSSTVRVDGIAWTRVDTLGLSGPTSEVYIVDIDIDGNAYVTFGNNVNGKIPGNGLAITADYYECEGLLGNVDANTITTKVSTITITGVTTVDVTNELAASGGSDYEDIERIRSRAPLSIRTLDRAVTLQDYADVALLAPGVEKAKAQFTCGKAVQIYIIPTGGGTAQSGLLTSVLSFMNIRKMVTTSINTRPAGETRLMITIEATAKYRMSGNEAKDDIIAALLDFGSLEKQDINKAQRKSDIVALIDNLEKVDFLDLVFIGTRPYARPHEHNVELNWERETVVTATAKHLWSFVYQGSDTWTVVKDGVAQADATTDVEWEDTDLKFTIGTGSYSTDQVWQFTTYPVNKDLKIDDYTLPTITEEDLDITVEEQLIL